MISLLYIYCFALMVRFCLQVVDNQSTNSLGYNRGGYSQNRWGSNYRDGGSGSRGGYNRSQQTGGSYNHNRQGSYNKSVSGSTGGYNQSQVLRQSLHCPPINFLI